MRLRYPRASRRRWRRFPLSDWPIPPKGWSELNCMELVLKFVPSFRPEGPGSGLDLSIKDSKFVSIHGWYPSWRDKKGYINSITASDEKIKKGFLVGPKYGIHTRATSYSYRHNKPKDWKLLIEMRMFWRSIMRNKSDEEFWIYQWRKHGVFHRFWSAFIYWKLAIKAARPFFEDDSPLNLDRIIASLGFEPNHDYPCQDLVEKIRKRLGISVNVTFFKPARSQFYYISDFLFAFHKSGRLRENEPHVAEYPLSHRFIFENMASRRAKEAGR